MNRRLIINADDFGLSEKVTDAIIECHLNGIVSSTTIMANMPAFEYAVANRVGAPELGIGIHFNLTQGKPLSKSESVRLLVNDKGEFLNNLEQRRNLIFYSKEKLKQLKSELALQLERCLDHGLIPTHFDSHHHITGLPLSLTAAIHVAKKYNIKKGRTTSIRFRKTNPNVSIIKHQIRSFPKELIHSFNKLALNTNGIKTPDDKILPSRVLPINPNFIDHFIQTLGIIPNNKTVEISFHPGFSENDLKQREATKFVRERDFKIATSKLVIDYVNKNFELMSYEKL